MSWFRKEMPHECDGTHRWTKWRQHGYTYLEHTCVDCGMVEIAQRKFNLHPEGV